MVTPQDKLNGLRELAMYRYQLKQCKWYEYKRKYTLKAIINIIKTIYEI